MYGLFEEFVKRHLQRDDRQDIIKTTLLSSHEKDGFMIKIEIENGRYDKKFLYTLIDDLLLNPSYQTLAS